MIHVVLFEPEIAQNTGNIMRTCAASGVSLHLVEPTGFVMDDRRFRRSVMDYGTLLHWTKHVDLEHCLSSLPNASIYPITRYGQQVYSAPDFTSSSDVVLVFGKESTGLPKSFLQAHASQTLRIPMIPDARSLNLANSVALVLYEVLRQQGYPGLSDHEVLKGANWLFQ